MDTPTAQTLSDNPITRRQKHYRRKNRYADAFESAGLQKEAQVLRDCHETEILAACSNCGHAWWVPYRCRTRVCPLCSYKVMLERSQLMLALCRGMDHPKLLTLTMPTWTDDPKQGIRFLRASFARLRRTALLRKVVGGAYQIELIPKQNGWHIHIHVLMDAPYLPYQLIYSAWQKITGINVPQIDIRAASDPAAQVYVCKYAAKSVSFNDSPDVIVAWYLATKGQRLFATFGKWYNKKLRDIAPELCPPVAPSICPHCNAEKTTFLARDGPHIYGWDVWKDIKAHICPDDITMRDDATVKGILYGPETQPTKPTQTDPTDPITQPRDLLDNRIYGVQ